MGNGVSIAQKKIPKRRSVQGKILPNTLCFEILPQISEFQNHELEVQSANYTLSLFYLDAIDFTVVIRYR
jgi:hypothetical protein